MIKFLLLSLLIISCGKENGTGGPGMGINLSKDPVNQASGNYSRLNQLDWNYENSTVIKGSEEKILDFKKYSMIKAKAIFNYIHGKKLESSFEFGDDLAVSFSNDQIERLYWLSESSSLFELPLKLKNTTDSKISDISFKIKKTNLKTGDTSILSQYDINLWDDQPLAILPGETNKETTIEFSLEKLSDDEFVSIELNDYLKDKNSFKKDYRKKFQNLARVYISDPNGEEIFYVNPGTSIADFLKSKFSILEISNIGEIIRLGDSQASVSSVSNAYNKEDTFWITNINLIEEKSFKTNKAYVLVLSSLEETLRIAPKIKSLEKSESHTVATLTSTEKALNIFKINLYEEKSFVKKQSGKVTATCRPHVRDRIRYRDDIFKRNYNITCGATYGVWASKYKRISEFSEKDFKIENSERTLNMIDNDSAYLLSSFGEDNYLLRLNRENNLTPQKGGFLGAHGCNPGSGDVISYNASSETLNVGDHYTFGLTIIRLAHQ